MSREVLRDAVIYLPAKVVPALVGVLAIPILTRMLSPEQYGQYLLAMTSLSLIASFCISWLVSVTIRFYVVYGVESLFRVCRPLLIAAVIFGCVLWAAAVLLLGGAFKAKDFVLIGILWLVAYGGFEYFAGWLRARNQARAYSLALSWRSVVGLLVAVTLLSLGFRGGAIVILGAACAMLVALVFLPRHALKADHNQPQTTESSTRLQTVLRYGIPAAFINLTTVGLSMADRYVIGAQMGADAVAIYGASYDLAEKTVFFANSMLLLSSSVIGFRIFEQEGEAKAADFLSRLMRLYLLAAPPLVAGLAILSPHIVAVLLPAKYAEGAFVLPIVALGGLFVGIMHRYSLLLSFHKRTDIIMWCSVIALAVNLASCLLLIPIWGFVGAAISTLLAYAALLILIRLAALKYIGPSFPWMTLLRVTTSLIVGSGIFYACMGIFPDTGPAFFSIVLLLGFLVYLVTLYALREITRKDLKSVVDSIASKIRT